MSEEPAKTASKTPHFCDGGVIAENAADEPANEDAGTVNPVAEKDTEHATSEMGGRSTEREPSAEHTPGTPGTPSPADAKHGSRALSSDHTVSEADAKHGSRALSSDHTASEADAKHFSRALSSDHTTPEADAKHGSRALSSDHTASEADAKHGSRAFSSDHTTPEADAKHGSRALSSEHPTPEIGDKRPRRKSGARQSSGKPNAERTGSDIDTDRTGSEIGTKRSSQHATVETTAGPATEGSKVEPKTKTDASSKAGGKAAPRLAAREDSSPGNTGRIIELVVFAVIIAVVVMVGAAMFNAAHGSLPKDKQTYGGDDLLGTAIYRRLRSWHGYGPQLLVCTLGERRSVVAPESLPPDGLCDVVLYAHVLSLGSEFHDGASANLRALWTRAATAVNTRFGYSFSDSLLPIDERELEAFVRRAVDDKKIGAFGMLDARWDRDAKNNESYATFVEALNRTTKLLPTDRRAALVFGFRVNPDTSARGVEFLNSHAAILDHVHVIVYQGHVELPPQNDSAKSECAVRFPSPRFQQAKDSDQTMQDGVAAIDTALHFRKDRLATDICVSVALSGLRYSLTRAARENKELEAKCANATAVPYADVCPSNGTSGGVKILGEGVLVTRKPYLVLDVFDDSETLAQKLRTAKLALSLSAQPHWSFCLAAFNVEHEDSDGACGESFERLTVARSFLHGKLRWHDD